MTEEAWQIFGDVIQAILLRFKDAELEIEILKFRIEQLEKDKVNE